VRKQIDEGNTGELMQQVFDVLLSIAREKQVGDCSDSEIWVNMTHLMSQAPY